MKSPGDADEGVLPLHCRCCGEADHKNDFAGNLRDVEVCYSSRCY